MNIEAIGSARICKAMEKLKTGMNFNELFSMLYGSTKKRLDRWGK